MSECSVESQLDTGGSSRAQTVACAVLAAVLVGLGVWTVHRFIVALVWAGVFAIAIWPLYQAAQRRWPGGKHNVLLPAMFTMAVALLFLIPLALIGVQVGREARAAFSWVHDAQQSGVPVPDWVRHVPLINRQASAWWQDNLSDAARASELLGRVGRGELFSYGRALGPALAHRVVLFGFTLLTLFFLFRDGEALAAQLRHASRRVFGPRGERVGLQVIASIKGTVDGLVLVGLAEGVLMGFAYAVAGVPHPALFGAVTGVAAMIPFAAPIVFAVVGVILMAGEHLAAAATIVALGTVVVFVADHFIRPVLIGGTTRLPFLWVLLGILGGVEVWGLLGLFVGPAVMAALVLLWREWTNPVPVPPADVSSTPLQAPSAPPGPPHL